MEGGRKRIRTRAAHCGAHHGSKWFIPPSHNVHEDRRQLRQHQRKTHEHEVNEEEPEREASGDEGHVNRLFLKEYQDLLTSDVKEDRKRSTEEADQAQDTNTVSTRMRR